MNKFLIILFDFAIFFELLWGAHAWFTWNLDSEYTYSTIAKLAVFVISVVYAKCFAVNIRLTRRCFWAMFALFVAFMIGHLGLKAVLNFILVATPLYILLVDHKHIDSHIRFINTGLTVILIPGIILHILMVVKGGVFLGYPIQYPNMKVYTFVNYGFLLKGVMNYEADGFRFQSIFLEPGYLGTMLSFLLYTVRFNLKPFVNKVILIALLLSLSLAGIGIMLIGYMICSYEKGKSIKRVLALFSVLALVCVFGFTYNDGNNVVNEKILSRFELDQEKGIAGNNRVSYTTDKFFDRYLHSGDLVWGIGSEQVQKINGGGSDDAAFADQIRGAGYKVYFINYGMVSAFVYLLFYWLLGKTYTRKMNMHMFGFWIIIVITFVQAAYPASFSWLIPYFCAVSLERKNQFFQEKS